MAIKLTRLLFSIVICQLAGVIGSLFTFPSLSSWYASLAKPTFNPPGWVFGPAWTTLFLLMGIALYLVWSKGTKPWQSREALAFFGVQLLLNVLWSALFFGLRSPLTALVEIARVSTFFTSRNDKTSATNWPGRSARSSKKQ